MAYLQCVLRSASVRMDTSLSVILPVDKTGIPGYRAVLYLLHGLGGNAQSWMRYSRIESYADKYNIAVIMPQADRSFYTGMRYGGDYFTYITEELPELCNKMFRLPAGPENTYIAGLSMGGYGTLRCIFGRPELYAGGASFSAVTDIHWRLQDTKRDDPRYRDLQAVFGAEPEPAGGEDLFAAVNAISAKVIKEKRRPELYISCGTEDTRYEQNVRLSNLLKKEGYDHVFEGWTGDHDWDFWEVSIQKALAFFFDK